MNRKKEQEGKAPVYIYEIPISIRRPLCNYLDSLKPNIWDSLAEQHFQFNPLELQAPKSCINRGESPSEFLLTMWSNRGNHMIIELYVTFKNANLVEGMRILSDLVDKKFHKWLTVSAPSEASPSKTNDEWRIIRILSKEDGDPELIKEIRNLDSLMSVPRINFEELQNCTNNWKNTLGKGGFGCVYSGEWKKTKVAIKQLSFSEKGGIKTSVRMIVNEMKLLNSCRHTNVLQVFAFSIDEIPCLVFELMDGNLDSRLKTNDPLKKLSWQQRFNIAMETCRGIQYLHTFQGPKQPLIHSDIKPMNILLDKYGHPKIGDFGLARESEDDMMEVSKVFGTTHYLPDDFKKDKILTTKIDTYSFGIVLYEIVTNAKVYDNKRKHKHLKDLVKATVQSGIIPNGFIDESIPVDNSIITFLIRVGLECVVERAGDRPEMVLILNHFDTFYQNYKFS